MGSSDELPPIITEGKLSFLHSKAWVIDLKPKKNTKIAA